MDEPQRSVIVTITICGSLRFFDMMRGYVMNRPDTYLLPSPGDDNADLCDQCENGLPPFPAKPDIDEWIQFKTTDPSWAEWRAKNNPSPPENNRYVTSTLNL